MRKSDPSSTRAPRWIQGFCVLVLTTSLVACPSSSVAMSGRVLDARSQDPVAGATVTVGTETTTSADDGSFALTDVPDDAPIRVEAANYEPATSTVSGGASADIALVPIPVQVTVVSNLTGKGLRATIRTGDQEARSDTKGRASLYGVGPGVKVRVLSSGYEQGRHEIPTTRKLRVRPLAGPAATARQIAEWERRQQWKPSAALIHPDAFSYVTRAEVIAENKQAAREGSQLVGVAVRRVSYITWTFQRCSQADFGPKRYKNTAALDLTYIYSAPAGGRERLHAITHYVRTPDGRWRYFPILGCD